MSSRQSQLAADLAQLAYLTGNTMRPERIQQEIVSQWRRHWLALDIVTIMSHLRVSSLFKPIHLQSSMRDDDDGDDDDEETDQRRTMRFVNPPKGFEQSQLKPALAACSKGLSFDLFRSDLISPDPIISYSISNPV